MSLQTGSSAPAAALRPTGANRRFASIRTIVALMLREMATTYGRSPGGYLWAVLEPAAGIALLTVIFSIGFKSPPIGTNFPIFYATGMVPFLLYMDVSGKVSLSIVFSKPLLGYPSVKFLDALIARFLINFITQILVAYVIFAAILLIFETRTVLDLPKMGLSLAMAGALAFGIGTMNCFLMTMFPVWKRIWNIVNRPLFIISCIFFVFDTIPEPYRGYLWYNPLIHVVGMMRDAFFPSYHATYVSPAYVFGLSLSLTVFGLVFLARYHRDLLND